jgi:dihydroneopterin aldolase
MTFDRHQFSHAEPIHLPRHPINRVFLRGLEVDAFIGYYDHEKGQTQPLSIDAELWVIADHFHDDVLAKTVDYDDVAGHARSLASGQHIELIETFAERLAALILSDARVAAVKVRIEKPRAVSRAMAGVEIIRVAASVAA